MIFKKQNNNKESTGEEMLRTTGGIHLERGMYGWRVTIWSLSTLASGQYSPKSHWETKKRKFLERGNPGVALSRLSALLETLVFSPRVIIMSCLCVYLWC